MTSKEWKVDQGTVQFRLESGVLLDAMGPFEARLDSPARLKLLNGRLNVEVGFHGKGFVVETAAARVVDLGTRFGINATQVGETDVVVFEGEVAVHESRAQKVPFVGTLVEGEGLRFDSNQNPRRIECVFTGRRNGDWATHVDAGGAVISDVRDNLMEQETKRFYRVAHGEMEVGAEARHTRGRRWYPLDSDTLPDWLLGSDVVETFATDANNSDFHMMVTLARPAILYVIHDLQQAPPSWLQSRFTDTGLRLRLERGPLNAEAAAPRPFAVWKSPPLPAGIVTLGAQREIEQLMQGKMYGVAAKAIDSSSTRGVP